jgi:hypothetical protein
VIAAEKLGKTPQHVDDSSAQQLYARHVYSWRDIRWQHGYRNITSVSPQGRVLLDFTKFHVRPYGHAVTEKKNRAETESARSAWKRLSTYLYLQ